MCLHINTRTKSEKQASKGMKSIYLKLLMLAVSVSIAMAQKKKPGPLPLVVVQRNVAVQIKDQNDLCLLSIVDPLASTGPGDSFNLVTFDRCQFHGQQIGMPSLGPKRSVLISSEWEFQSGYASHNPSAVPKYTVVLMSSQGFCISPRSKTGFSDINNDLADQVINGEPCDKSKQYLRFKVESIPGYVREVVKFSNAVNNQVLLSSFSQGFIIVDGPATLGDMNEIEQDDFNHFIQKIQDGLDALKEPQNKKV